MALLWVTGKSNRVSVTRAVAVIFLVLILLLPRGYSMTLPLIQNMTLLKMTVRQTRSLTLYYLGFDTYLPTLILIWLHVLFQVPTIVWKMITLKSTFSNYVPQIQCIIYLCLHSVFFLKATYMQLICKVTAPSWLSPVIPHSEKGCVSLSIDCCVLAVVTSHAEK